MSRLRATLWTDFACAGGVAVAEFRIAAGKMWRTKDGDGRFDFSVSPESAAYGLLGLRGVVRILDHRGEVTEWRIRRIGDRSVPDRGLVSVSALPPFYDLTHSGPIWEPRGDGSRAFNLGLNLARPVHYWDSLILPGLARIDIGWVERGIMERWEKITLTWDRAKASRIAHDVAAKVGGELRFRRNGEVGYLLDLLTEVGAGTPPLLITVGRNLREHQRERDADPMETVVIPTGLLAPGSPDRATMAEASWKVGAIAGLVLTLAARNDGPGPVGEDGQLDGVQLVKRNGTLTAVTASSAADQTVTVAEASDIAVGDDVGFLATVGGGRLEELSSPSAVAELGRQAKTLEVEEARAERNYVLNPFLTDLPDPTVDAVACRVDGLHGTGSTSINLDGLTGGFQVKAGDVLLLPQQTAFAAFYHRILADATANGAGEVTVTIGTGISSADNAPAGLFRQAARLPDEWGVWNDTPLPGMRRIREHSGQLVAEGDGAQTDVNKLALRGLTPGDVIQAGDSMLGKSALSTVAADGAGKAVVPMTGEVTITDGGAVTIERPKVPGFGSQIIGLACPGLTSVGWASETVAVRYAAGQPPVWASVALTLQVGLQGPWEPDPANPDSFPPRLLLRDPVADLTLASLAFPKEDISVPALGQQSIVLRAQWQPDQTRPLQIVIQPPRPANMFGDRVFPITWIRAAQIHVGYDEEAPFHRGALATELHQAGNLRLEERASVPTRYQVSLADLGVPGEDVVVGARADLRDDVLGVRTSPRFVEHTYFPERPAESEVVLDTVSERLSDRLGRQRPAPLWVDLRDTRQ